MISTIPIENETGQLESLQMQIEHSCPFLEVSGIAETLEDAKPLQDEAFMATVSKAKARILAKEESRMNRLLFEKILWERKANELIGIPTMEGYEFMQVKEIIRCEGLQKCTRVVTTTKTDIVSSYNIGEFIKLLEPYHFFSPHKSHLINLAYVRRYLREGTIVLKDNSCIPVSKRRKVEFLDRVIHL